ncbi:replication initiator protein [Klebsiella pneumoniae]|nr:replication initiator protein [Klebsiella pneumoniae]
MGSCAAPSAKGDDKFITTDYLQQCHPDLLTVHFKPDCTYFAKSILEGKKINAHSVPLNKSGLLERWLRFDV